MSLKTNFPKSWPGFLILVFIILTISILAWKLLFNISYILAQSDSSISNGPATSINPAPVINPAPNINPAPVVNPAPNPSPSNSDINPVSSGGRVNPIITTTTTPATSTEPQIIVNLPQPGIISGDMAIEFFVKNNQAGAIRYLEAYCGDIYLLSFDIKPEELVKANWNTNKLPDGLCNFYIKNNQLRSADINLMITNQVATTTPIIINPIATSSNEISSSTTEITSSTTELLNKQTKVTTSTSNKKAIIKKPIIVVKPTPAATNESTETAAKIIAPSVINETTPTAAGEINQTPITGSGVGGATINLEAITNTEGLVADNKLTNIDEPTTSGTAEPSVFKVTSVESIARPPVTPNVPVTPVLILKGRALPNSYVILYIYSKPIVVVVKTDADGNWTYYLDKPLPDGQHEVYVAATNTSGKIVSKSEPFTFFIKSAQAVTETEYNNGALNVSDPFQKTQNLLRQQIIFFGLGLIFLIGLIILYYVWKNYRAKHQSISVTKTDNK